MATTFADDLRHDFDELARRRPELWAKCYPKVYEGVDGGEYYSAKLVGYFLLSVAIKIEQPEVQMYRHFTETVEAIWASRLVANRVPIFWLTREITEALKLTTLPVTLDFTTMKLPFEAAVFMLPKGSLTYQSEETDVVCVSYARAGMREEIASINPATVEIISGRGDFTVLAGMSTGCLLNWRHPWEQPLDIAKLDGTIDDLPNEPLRTRFQYDVNTYDRHFMARAARLVFNTLQLMLARPNLVSMGPLVKQVHDKKKSCETLGTATSRQTLRDSGNHYVSSGPSRLWEPLHLVRPCETRGTATLTTSARAGISIGFESLHIRPLATLSSKAYN
jgi:hypothetical protein